MAPLVVCYWIWGLWAASWFVAAAVWSDHAARRASRLRQANYQIVTFAGVGLLFGRNLGHALYWTPPVLTNALIVAQVIGLAFCWWARIHLGPLWSGSVGRKEDHRIVDTGPYGLVRHPIYTGLDFAALALAILDARPLAFVGAGLIIIGCWIKFRLEETFLREELGTEAYDAYAVRTPALVPFWPSRR